MDTSNHKSVGYFATQPPKVQSRIVTKNISTFGENIRLWPAAARKELAHGPFMDITSRAHGLIGTAPKLLLTVVSTGFRSFFASSPNSTSITIQDANVSPASISALLKWAKELVADPSAKYGVKMPEFHADMFRLYYAAKKLGMEQYVSYFHRIYRDAVRQRTPSREECGVLEQLCVGLDGAFINDAAARLAYLRRNKLFVGGEIKAFAEFLKFNPNMQAAVQAADERVLGRKYY